MTAVEAVADYVRDAAFTTLNRFVALKMLEARALIQESITRGEQSAGYHEFCGMAPGVALLPGGAGYRLYIEAIFEELSTEVKILFDWRDSASVMWPKRQAFEQVLKLLNAPDLSDAWQADETIGWVYQYFNSATERREMRDASSAPRNSRELAARNQFFTPRYVVQFLTDNTLGRLWYEMHDANTRITDACTYLVRTPGDHFEQRPKKDPRDIRVLDPACGSGHFLLYAFDLLLVIYEEAWHDPASPPSDITGRRLWEDYPTFVALLVAAPELILRHNLHGIDIDQRCAQIAQLALWMRAQRAFHVFNVPRIDRPRVRRTNITVAEPVAGDEPTLRAFQAKLADPELSQAFSELIDSLKLAGELGALLRLENNVRREPRRGEMGSLFAPLGSRLSSALLRFVDSDDVAARNRRRLFADDAAQGIGLLEMSEARFDVVLMNPPFGESCARTRSYVNSHYPRSSTDLGAVFVERGKSLLNAGGLVGAITSRTLLANQTFTDWRRALLDEGTLVVLVDLGHGVLDAMVETAMYVFSANAAELEENSGSAFLSLLECSDKSSGLYQAFLDISRFLWRHAKTFLAIPGSPWAYWVPDALLRRFVVARGFTQLGGQVCTGTQTGDDFRFYRLRWEVSPEKINGASHRVDAMFAEHKWSPVAKGGEYSLWWDDVYLLLDCANDRKEIKNLFDSSGKLQSRPQNLDKPLTGASTYPYRTTSGFGLRLLPPGVSFSVGGWGVYAPPGWTNEDVLASYNNRIARYLMEVLLGLGDSSAAGTAARNYGAAAVGGIPCPAPLSGEVRAAVQSLVDLAALGTDDETSLFFQGAKLFPVGQSSFEQMIREWWLVKCAAWKRSARLYKTVESGVIAAYGLSSEELLAVDQSEGQSLFTYPKVGIDTARVSEMFRSSIEQLTSMAKAACGAKRYTVKKAYFIDRSIDLASHICRAHPESIIEGAELAGPIECGYDRLFAHVFVSWLLGVAVGRFQLATDVQFTLPSELDQMPNRGLEDGSSALPVWVDDLGHDLDIVQLVASAATTRWLSAAEPMLTAAATLVETSDLREWFRYKFFSYHLSTYSKSRRKAPIYWQLGVPSAQYSVWLFYPDVTKDTMHKVISEVVAPKLRHEQAKLDEVILFGGDSPSAAQRKNIVAKRTLIDEIVGFWDELKRVAPLWNPDRDDGVIINYAPLWRLVPFNRSWQKELKETWDALCDGEFDWTSLALHLWPERVIPKCRVDRSIAIAHGLEDVFWMEDAAGKLEPRSNPTRSVDELVNERASPAIKAALKSLLEAPAAKADGSRARSRRVVTVGVNG